MTATQETIYLGGGCFWGVEHLLKQAQGVLDVESGYMGGMTTNPSYQEVCSGRTFHAEVVRVVYDTAVLPTEALLYVFFHLHDATQLNRQGPDVGTQYRSCIYTTTAEQLQAAATALHREQHRQQPTWVSTTVATAPVFTPAEAYHQDYFERHGYHGGCHVCDVEAVLNEYKTHYGGGG